MAEDEVLISSKFCKIMLPGFHQRLKLPPAFCKKIKHEKSKRAILESSIGRWEINVRREDDDQIFFEDGWPRFAHEHGLRLRDFLVFKHTGRLHFNVVICNSTGREKQFLVESDNEHQTIYPSYHAKKKAPLRGQRLSFNVKMTHYTVSNEKGKVTIPVEFVESNDVVQKEGAVLKDPRSGGKWRVRICVQNRPAFRVMMTRGWHGFAADNKLKVGDVCTFQLNPTKSATSRDVSLDVSISRRV